MPLDSDIVLMLETNMATHLHLSPVVYDCWHHDCTISRDVGIQLSSICFMYSDFGRLLHVANRPEIKRPVHFHRDFKDVIYLHVTKSINCLVPYITPPLKGQDSFLQAQSGGVPISMWVCIQTYMFLTSPFPVPQGISQLSGY